MRRLSSPRFLVALGLLAALGAGVVVSAQRASANMASAATKFLASLTAEQRQQATFALDSAEWTKWHFIPDETFPRNGLPLKAMQEPQRVAAQELLKSGLSERGYTTYSQIIQLEKILKVIETDGRMARDHDAYRFSVFGTPSAQGTWGWRVEGHHVSLHFLVVNGKPTGATPSFAGSNPAEVRVEGPDKGKRVLGLQEDSARALVTALDASQRSTAVIMPTAPNDILTEAKLDIQPLSPVGIKASAMTGAQRELLMKLVDAYAGLMAPDVAAVRMDKIKAAGVENVAFAWAGPVERGQKHYFRVQGPTFLIEMDNTQNNGNHVHSVWRDFTGDFGRDLLRDHLRTTTH
jgi:type II secretory pathway pseudopilin PulG